MQNFPVFCIQCLLSFRREFFGDISKWEVSNVSQSPWSGAKVQHGWLQEDQKACQSQSPWSGAKVQLITDLDWREDSLSQSPWSGAKVQRRTFRQESLQKKRVAIPLKRGKSSTRYNSFFQQWIYRSQSPWSGAKVQHMTPMSKDEFNECRNPLEAGQKFNWDVPWETSVGDRRNPLEAGQKFNLPEIMILPQKNSSQSPWSGAKVQRILWTLIL